MAYRARGAGREAFRVVSTPALLLSLVAVASARPTRTDRVSV
jgi:hypothetical protein